ncbi:MAG TPA: hypothetical protein VN700_08280 [Vicinamibacterales bacterium]|nr:hypothetical protein [Vicinamibacterales bacterium]
MRTPVLGAFLEGWRRVLRAPALAAGVMGATFLFALPMAAVVHRSMATHLGSSLEAESAAAGWNAGWATEFDATATGLSRTFTFEILGFGATLATVSRFVDNEPLNPALAWAIAAYIALWVFMSGGILDRLARSRPVRAGAFFSACGTYFFRFLRLAVVTGAAYWSLFRWLHPFLFGTLYNRWTRDMTEERDAIALRAGLYLVFFLAMAFVNLVADFAKVRAVVEDRRSMLSALSSSLRFIRRRFFRTTGLYLLNLAGALIVARLWYASAPSATAAPWLALLVAQVYLLLRIWGRLAFMASETVFFQGELAHANYAAAPEPVWPESPAAEAMRKLTD